MAGKGLRNIERLVLSGLELDSRKPLSRLARRIRKSQQQVSYIVVSLSKRGVIKGFYPIIDHSRLDVLSFRVYFRLDYTGEEKIHELLEHLRKDPHTGWVSSCGGRYDLICTFFTLNPSQFNKTLREIIARFPEQIRSYTVLTTAVTREFGRKYLFRNHTPLSQLIVGGDRAPEKVDDVDMKILQGLSQDARKSSVVMGAETSLTPKSVINRIKSLEKRKLILGFRPLLDVRSMGHVSNLLLLRYHNITVETENELIEYLKHHRNVVSIAKTLGEWDIEVEIETPDIMDFRRVEMEIRQRFRLLIQQTESVPLYQTHKKNYFPSFLMDSQGHPN